MARRLQLKIKTSYTSTILNESWNRRLGVTASEATTELLSTTPSVCAATLSAREAVQQFMRQPEMGFVFTVKR